MNTKQTEIEATGLTKEQLLILHEEFVRRFEMTPELQESVKRLQGNAAFRFVTGRDAPIFTEKNPPQ
jgi:hypothetical protein